VPNAFSPNDDLKNDVFYVRGNCITTMTFAIYDRWGEKVFESKDPTI
jgi:gliding motility-associated-like protein